MPHSPISDSLVTAQPKSGQSQFPVDWYFDEARFTREQELIFAHGPNYLGHEHMVPNIGDYQVLTWRNQAQVLVRSSSGIEVLSNICRHRQALLLEGRGNVQNIVCPLHRWTYDLHGTLLGAPHFPSNPCLNLAKTPCQSWQGLLFAGPRSVSQDLANLQIHAQPAHAQSTIATLSSFVLDRVVMHDCPYNWKTFIEVYLEDYHVDPYHPGLGQFVSCDDLSWQFGEHFSIQQVGIRNQLGQAGSKAYQRWQKALLEYSRGQKPDFGAIWLTYYPNIMVEWYPHVLVISTLYAKSPQSTMNVIEFYYPEEIALFEREFIAAQQAAYLETAEEDDDIALGMDAGRKALIDAGRDEYGPYQSPMEDGMQHFHRWYRQTMTDK